MTLTVVPSLVNDNVYVLKYIIAELDQIRYSHTFYGVPKPQYPHGVLQPRNATTLTRHYYLHRIYEYFDAWQFVAEFRQLALGTPIIMGQDVAVGNGRCAILAHAYEQEGWQAQSYLSALAERAEALGLTTHGYQKPVLVRQLMSEVDTFLFVNEANMRINQSYSKDETALVDAHYINGRLLLQLEVKESPEETLKANCNSRFVSDWLGNLPEAERAQVLNPQGYIDLTGIARLERALLARAYGENWLVRLTYDSFDNDIRTITNALRWSVIKVAQVEELIKLGERPREAAIAHDVLAAVNLYCEFKKQGGDLDLYLAQSQMFFCPNETQLTLVRMFSSFNRSATKIKARLDAWCDVVIAKPSTRQHSFL